MRLVELAVKYPECFYDNNRISVLLNDFYPNEPKSIEAVLAMYKTGIINDMMKRGSVVSSDIDQYVTYLASQCTCPTAEIRLLLLEMTKIFKVGLDGATPVDIYLQYYMARQCPKPSKVITQDFESLIYQYNKETDSYIVQCIDDDIIDDEAVIIPEQYRGKPVTGIADKAFCGRDDITLVVIPDTVTDIGESAFQSCTNLMEVDLPNTITELKDFCFDGCENLLDIKLPDSVTKIGCAAFRDCVCIEEIILPQGVTSIEAYTYSGCSNLKKVFLPDGVKKIDKYAFAQCKNLPKIVIPRNLEIIGDNVFSNCTRLTSILIPISVNKMGSNVFDGSRHLSVYVEADNKPIDWAYDWNSDNTIPVSWGFTTKKCFNK